MLCWILGLVDIVAAVRGRPGCALHLYFLVLEMFLWDKPDWAASVRPSRECAKAETKALAANQGLYNGFLAAGLVWGLLRRPGRRRRAAVLPRLRDRGRGLRRGTVNRRILVVQALPALVGFVLVLAAS